MGDFYTYDEDSCGFITIFDPDGNDIAFLQSEDDTSPLLAELAILDKIWLRRYGKGYRRKPFGPHASYEAHLSAILSAYDY